MTRGKFLVLEGGDGVGKSTQARLLASWLTARGVGTLETRQPGGTFLGGRLRELVLDPAMGEVAARAEALIYAADKAQHVVEIVEPALAAGLVVVCDRYVDSMVAYQGAGRGLGADEVRRLAMWATSGLMPDLTVLLDANPDDAVSRIESKDRLESAGDEFHRSVRGHFLHMAAEDPAHYVVVDARGSREDVLAGILRHVEPLLS